jgi:hypothetical protein
MKMMNGRGQELFFINQLLLSWHALRNKECVTDQLVNFIWLCCFQIIITEVIENKMRFSTVQVNMLKENHEKSNFCMVAYKRLQSWATNFFISIEFDQIKIYLMLTKKIRLRIGVFFRLPYKSWTFRDFL